MAESLRNKTIAAMLWSTVGKFGTLAIQFITNMVLARLLMPEDFGVIGMLTIFIVISEVFIVGGFGQALIQKKNPTHIDYTTVFYWNLVASILIYIILYLCSPSIAHFYNMPNLTSILRVYSLVLIISSFSIVQTTHLQKKLDFKTLSIRNIIAAACGTIVSIYMALSGYGVWSLVASYLINAVASVFLLWGMSSWRPTLEFSWKSFRELFSFGSLMAVSSLVDQFYKEVQGLIIGKWYSAGDLGYYTQAKKLENIPTSSLSQIVSQVTFPVFSKMQDDKTRLKEGVRKCAKSLTYLNFPMCMLLIVIASPLISLLYGDRWEPAVPYFQLLCISGMFYTILTMNNSVIKSLGKSKIFLYVRLIQRFFGIGFIVWGAYYSVEGLLIGVVASQVFNYLVTTTVNKKLLGYGIIGQIKDIGVALLVSVIVGCLTYTLYWLPFNKYLLMFLQILLYCGLYLAISKILNLAGYRMIMDIISSKLRKS